MGDVPIYVAGDSADVWANRELFQLDEHGQPTVVAGVPPDYFSATGQRWGNPLYRWDLMRETQYRWWVARVRTNLRFADIVRLDHFRGFAAYWEIPASEDDRGARTLDARPRPRALRNAATRARSTSAHRRRPRLHHRGCSRTAQSDRDCRACSILQFGFGQDDSPHLPHRFEPHTVVYTGTHDNDTARGWFEAASTEERDNARAYLGCSHAEEIATALIRAAYTSVAEAAIVPVQDILGLASDARMNTPGEEQHNWTWRLAPGILRNEHAVSLRKLAAITGRV